MLTEHNKEMLLKSHGRALATWGVAGINVVPVSVVDLDDDDIILYDFFMQKSVLNIKNSPNISLVVWEGFVGIQIKGQAIYECAGDFFQQAVTVMKVKFPDRILKGVIRIKVEAVFSVSAGAEAGKQLQ